MRGPNDSILVHESVAVEEGGRGKVSEKTENYIHVSTDVLVRGRGSERRRDGRPSSGRGTRKGPGATLGLIDGSAQCRATLGL